MRVLICPDRMGRCRRPRPVGRWRPDGPERPPVRSGEAGRGFVEATGGRLGRRAADRGLGRCCVRRVGDAEPAVAGSMSGVLGGAGRPHGGPSPRSRTRSSSLAPGTGDRSAPRRVQPKPTARRSRRARRARRRCGSAGGPRRAVVGCRPDDRRGRADRTDRGRSRRRTRPPRRRRAGRGGPDPRARCPAAGSARDHVPARPGGGRGPGRAAGRGLGAAAPHRAGGARVRRRSRSRCLRWPRLGRPRPRRPTGHRTRSSGWPTSPTGCDLLVSGCGVFDFATRVGEWWPRPPRSPPGTSRPA